MAKDKKNQVYQDAPSDADSLLPGGGRQAAVPAAAARHVLSPTASVSLMKNKPCLALEEPWMWAICGNAQHNF